MFVVAALFEVEKGKESIFREAILRNAATSLRDEPGCHRFDVCFDDGERRCFLYELYEDEAAFDAHVKSDHFRTFDEATASAVADRRVETYQLVQSG